MKITANACTIPVYTCKYETKGKKTCIYLGLINIVSPDKQNVFAFSIRYCMNIACANLKFERLRSRREGLLRNEPSSVVSLALTSLAALMGNVGLEVTLLFVSKQ